MPRANAVSIVVLLAVFVFLLMILFSAGPEGPSEVMVPSRLFPFAALLG